LEKSAVATNQGRKNRGWQYAAIIMALLHMCLWIAVAFSYPRMENVEPLIPVDFPLSFVLVVLGWNSPHLLIWFGVLGTLWWYVLVRFVEIVWNLLIKLIQNRYRGVDSDQS
jgi:hypothetical protein